MPNKITTLVLSRIREGTCHSVGITYNENVAPRVFLANLMSMMSQHENLMYSSYSDLIDLFEGMSDKDFYQSIRGNRNLVVMPLGYDGFSCSQTFVATMKLMTETNFDLTSKLLIPIKVVKVDGNTYIPEYFNEKYFKKTLHSVVHSAFTKKAIVDGAGSTKAFLSIRKANSIYFEKDIDKTIDEAIDRGLGEFSVEGINVEILTLNNLGELSSYLDDIYTGNSKDDD